MGNKEQILEDRAAGMTYKEIGEKYGISRQRVCEICKGRTPKNFHYVTDEGCVYPNLRAWMNENLVSRSEFIRRSKFEFCPGNTLKFSAIMRGEITDVRKNWIDEMLRITGMSYEMLFDDRLWRDDDATD